MRIDFAIFPNVLCKIKRKAKLVSFPVAVSRDFPKDACLPGLTLAFYMPPGFKKEKRKLLNDFYEVHLRKPLKNAICKVGPKFLNAFCKISVLETLSGDSFSNGRIILRQ